MHLELCMVRYRSQDARQQNGQINGITGRAGGALNCVTTTPKSHRPTIDQRAVFKLHGVVTWSQVKDQQKRYYRCAFRALSFVRCKSPSVVQHAKGVRLVHTKSNEEDEGPHGLAEDRGNGPYRRQHGARAREGERGGQVERIVGTLDTILVAPPHVHLRRDLEESRCGGQTLGPSAPWSAETFPRRSRKQWRPVKLHS